MGKNKLKSRVMGMLEMDLANYSMRLDNLTINQIKEEAEEYAIKKELSQSCTKYFLQMINVYAC